MQFLVKEFAIVIYQQELSGDHSLELLYKSVFLLFPKGMLYILSNKRNTFLITVTLQHQLIG